MPVTSRKIATTATVFTRQIEELPSHTARPLHALRRKCSKGLADWDGRAVVQLALRLLRRSEHAYRFFGSALVFHHPPALKTLTPAIVEELGQGIDSWGDVDIFACYLSGPAWRLRRVSDQRIHRWAGSENRWWRRAALVSTAALNRKSLGGTGDVPRTLAVCRLLVEDSDDMVVKALSWALRELVPHDARAVREFLREHQDTLAARVVREVTCKLTTGVKNPRRRNI